MKRLFVFILLVYCCLAHAQQSPKEVSSKLLEAISNIKTLQMDIISKERLSNRTTFVKQKLEASVNPFKVKITFITPNDGAIVQFNEGENDNEIHYDPNGFPYFSLNIDPLGSLARRNNHHTIYEAGFSYLADILEYETNRNLGETKVTESYFNNQKAILYEANHEDFKFIKYKMKEGETIRSLALKKRISEYKILEINDNLSFYDDNPDEEILIPNYFCKNIKIYINPKNMIPVSVQIFDEKGLLERFDYENVIINPTFKSDYFKID